MHTSAFSSFPGLIRLLRRRVPALGAACLLLSCSGQPQSAGPSPVSFADEEEMPSADLASIAANQDTTTQELQALLDQQDPSAWSLTPVGKNNRPARILEAPDENAAGSTTQVKHPRTRSIKPKAAASASIIDDSVPAPDPDALVVANPAVVQIDAADSTRSAAPSPAAESPTKARERLVSEIAGSLRQETQSTGGATIEREGLGLLALDIVQPGSVDSELEAYARGLSSAEARSFESLRSLFRTLGDQSGGGDSTGAVLDSTRLHTTLSSHASKLADGEPLLISSASLCTSVDGYGRYMPFASTTFVQGRAHPAIVYLAVDHVTQTQLAASPGSGGRASSTPPRAKTTLGAVKSAVNSVIDGASSTSTPARDDGLDWAIDLAQSAVLYHDKDNLQVFNFGEQTLRDVSRDKRRDFCVARRIELPASLSLGRYNLKVTVRDKSGNATAEAIIPIQIVADPSLAR